MRPDGGEMHIREWQEDSARDNGLRKPRHLYQFIKQSYEGIREPDISRLSYKLHREAESVLASYGADRNSSN